MKVFKVWTDVFDYDTYDAVVVVADDADTAKYMATMRLLNEWQEPICVEEVDLEAPHVILASFNAG